jgi:hypothetical protein
MFEVQLVNNDGGGFSEKHAVNEGTTISEFLSGRLDNDLKAYKIRLNSQPAVKAYKIRLNSQPAAYDDVLTPNSRIVCTPLKIDGGS